MSDMAQQFPDIDDIVRIAEHQPQAADDLDDRQDDDPDAPSPPWKKPLKLLATGIIAPVLVAAATLAFLIVLTDFAFFRLRDIRNGRPQPKGLWEF
jgi:hypothetical protein